MLAIVGQNEQQPSPLGRAYKSRPQRVPVSLLNVSNLLVTHRAFWSSSFRQQR
ncbi:unnamed protein product [Amoebophrya sp. A120]|nr:unnamed protein product [Amoebophrya sp. A120]|eukprot:GSA120T00017120001.1